MLLFFGVLSGCHSSPHFVQSKCEESPKCALVLQEGARLQQVCVCGGGGGEGGACGGEALG